jgi:hypothetical protein
MNIQLETFNTECNKDIHSQTNRRIYERNIPSQPLQAYLDVRAVPTKYQLMPVVDPRPELSVKMVQLPTYNSHNVFNPGNTQSPWSGFASGINTESVLRNQIFALQKCSQSVYVPNSTSDLYQYNFNPQQSVGQQHQPFPHLFQQQHFNEFNPNVENIGHMAFMNNTRCQLKDLPQKPNCM